MKIHFLFHVPFEGAGAIESWAKNRGHVLSQTRLWQEPHSLQPEDLDALVIMGGPMNIYEEAKYPWLIEEKKFIQKVIRLKKKTLGVCLGAQLIADVLGAKVYANQEKEIGWMPVEFLPAAQKLGLKAESYPVFQWHGDTFHLPQGAEAIARSEACVNQAFLFENHALGLQFHLESTPESVKALVQNCSEDLTSGAYVQTREAILNPAAPYLEIQKTLDIVLTSFLKGE